MQFVVPRLKKLSIPKGIASEEDIAKLKADQPMLVVKWTQPDTTTIQKTKATFLRQSQKQKRVRAPALAAQDRALP